MDTSALPVTDARPKRDRKHDISKSGYMNDDGDVVFMVGCKCGFNMVELSETDADQIVSDHRAGKQIDRPEPTTLYTSKGDEVQIRMKDDQAADILVSLERSNFAQSLAQSFYKYGKWTDGQRPWAHKLANDHHDQQQQLQEKITAEPTKDDVVLDSLVEMMYNAATNLKSPKVRGEFENGETIRLSIAGQGARVPGSINVTSDGGYGNSTWYGRIMKNGIFDPARQCPDWVLDLLQEFNDDPAAVASAYGHRTGNCCFCGLEIKTKESLAVGYGPICAGHYGLPWG